MSSTESTHDRPGHRARRQSWRLPLLGIVAGLVGGILVLVGAIAVLRAGLGGSWERPVVGVAGLSHTALLGVLEIAAGVLVALAGLTDTRASVLLCGTALAVGGVIITADSDELGRQLAVTTAHGWWVMALAAVLLLAVLVTPEAEEPVRRLRLVEHADLDPHQVERQQR